MRQIHGHEDGHGLNDSITISADELDPQSGAASHYYVADMENSARNPIKVAEVQFQHGPRHEPGSKSGVTEAVLLTIVADRMRSFNAGPFACRENALVLTKVEEALHWLKHRADERAKRGVLGKNEK